MKRRYVASYANEPGFSQCEDHVVSLGNCAGAYKGADGQSSRGRNHEHRVSH